MQHELNRILWDQNPDALVAFTADGIVVQWNPSAEAIFGYRQDEAVGASLFTLIVPGNRVDEEKRIQADAIRLNQTVYESIRKRKDGSLVHVSVSTRAVRDEGGGFGYFLSNMKDVTHLKVLRDAKLVEARFRDLLESTPDAIVMVNVTGRIVLINSQAEEVFGYARSELLGKPVEVLLPDRFRAGHLGHRAGFFGQPRKRTMGAGLELYARRRSGHEFPVEISLSPLETEEGTMVMSAIRDITDRKRADQKFKDLLESAPDAMVIVDRDGAMVLVNMQAVRLFGWARDELLGQRIEMLVPERFRGKHSGNRTGFFSQPRARSMGAGLDLFGLRKDGAEFPVEISLSPLETEEGLFVSSAIRDVTERKRFEQTLRDKNLELENAARAKDRFFATMSHELRTPLNAIIGFTGTLLMELPGALNPEQARQLGIVQTGARHLLSLINDLLDLASLEADKLVPRLETIDCNAVMEEVAAIMRPDAEKKGLLFTLNLPDAVATVLADRRALSQIVLNLTGNAIKFTERGGICLQLEQRATEDRRTVSITVQDSGPGIPLDDQKRLFQPFSRGSAAHKGNPEGTGLGLHLSRQLAEKLGGNIRFETEYGHGSSFILELAGA